MIRRITVLILFFALSSPPMAVASVAGLCAVAETQPPSHCETPARNAHACCTTAEATDACDTGSLAMSCCSLDTAPYQETGAGALPAYAPIQPDQLDISTPLRGLHVVEPAVHAARTSPEMDTGRSPPPMRALFCTYLI